MKLLLVADALEGGLGASVEAERDRLTALGVEVVVAAGASDQLRAGRDTEVPIPEAIADVAGSRAAIAALRAVAQRFRPDQVHAHGARSFLLCRLAGLRDVAVTHHGFGRRGDEAWLTFQVRRVAMGALPYLATVAFTATPELSGRWRFLPLPSPYLPALPSPLAHPPVDPPTFTWVGRLAQPKRPDVFVRAVAAVASERSIRGRIAGEGPMADMIRREISTSSAPIEMLGHVDPLTAMTDTHTVVLTSEFEALSFSVQEAMWCGRAVVASPLAGLRWLLGPAGRYAEDEDRLAQHLRQLCDVDVAVAEGRELRGRAQQLLGALDPWATVLSVLEQEAEART